MLHQGLPQVQIVGVFGKGGPEVLEIQLACVVRPVHLNEVHVALGAAAGNTVAWLLDEFFELVVVSLAPHFGARFWRHGDL